MNAVSQASSALNQLNVLKEQGDMQFEQKQQQVGQEIEIPSELSLTAGASFLGKKLIGAVAEKVSSSVSNIASKVGISEETIAKAASGDIQGALEQGAQEVGTTISNTISGAAGEAGTAVSEAVSSLAGSAGATEGGLTSALSSLSEGGVSNIASSLSSQFGELSSGIVGRVAGIANNLPSIAAPTINIESAANMYSQGLEDVQSQFSFNSVPSAPAGAEIEMQNVTDFASAAPTDAADVADAAQAVSEATAAASAEASAGASAVEAAVSGVATAGEAAAGVAGAEAAGAGLDATGILAPLGALVGLIGGIVGIFEGSKQETETPTETFMPTLNPSSQFI